MLTKTANTRPKVRVITQTDIRNILRLIDTAWRVYTRVAPLELNAVIKAMPGYLAEDQVGLRGFMMVESQSSQAALLIAAGLRDTWGVRPYLDLLLPEIEQVVRAGQISALAYIGNAAWLIDGLQQRGFETREWIVVFERAGVEPPPTVPTPAFIRTAHSKDLPALLALDTLAFDYLWRKSVSNFTRALASAASFVLAEMDGQIVGYAWCELFRQHAHLTRLAVHPHYQRRGIGAQLLYQTISHVLARGGNRVTLNTQQNNLRSQSLYQRFGFVETRQRMPVLWKNLR